MKNSQEQKESDPLKGIPYLNYWRKWNGLERGKTEKMGKEKDTYKSNPITFPELSQVISRLEQ